MIGVGAGQQSRVDCCKLAGDRYFFLLFLKKLGRKVENWFMRFHDKVRNLPFKQGTKRVDRVNARGSQ